MDPMGRQGRKSVEWLARLGHGARGLVYLMVGGLAALAALGTGGQVSGSKGALRTFLSEPLGWVWVALIGLGLLFFALWRVLQATTDADCGDTSQSKSVGARIVYGVSALIYLGLAWWAVNVALGWAGGGGDDGAKGWTAWLMSQPFGAWLVMAAGIAIAVAGFFFYWKAWSEDFSDGLVGTDADHWLGLMGRCGFAARGLVFNIIGVLLIIAGLQSDPSQAEGLGGALRQLQTQAFGWIFLGLTAAGLAAFGIYNLAQAAYGQIQAPRP
jgi:hypothetical protein